MKRVRNCYLLKGNNLLRKAVLFHGADSPSSKAPCWKSTALVPLAFPPPASLIRVIYFVTQSPVLLSGTLFCWCQLPPSHLVFMPSNSDMVCLRLLRWLRQLHCMMRWHPLRVFLQPFSCSLFSSLPRILSPRGSSFSILPTFLPTSSITLSIQWRGDTACRNNVPQNAAKILTPEPCILVWSPLWERSSLPASDLPRPWAAARWRRRSVWSRYTGGWTASWWGQSWSSELVPQSQTPLSSFISSNVGRICSFCQICSSYPPTVLKCSKIVQLLLCLNNLA